MTTQTLPPPNCFYRAEIAQTQVWKEKTKTTVKKERKETNKREKERRETKAKRSN